MEDIMLSKETLKWVLSETHCYAVAAVKCMGCFKETVGVSLARHWPSVCYGCSRLCFLMMRWKDCLVRGFRSLFGLGTAALLVIIWSCFLCLTSMSCLLALLLTMGAAACTIHYLGHTPGIFIVGLIAILVLWMYGNFWITGTLFIIGGYLFSRKHARLVVLVATLYALHYVKVQVGWSGILVSVNLAFISNDALNNILQWCDNLSEKRQLEEQNFPDSFVEDKFRPESDFFVPTDEPETEKVQPPNDETEKVQPPNDDSEKVQPPNDESEKVQPPTDETVKVQPPTGKAEKVDRCESSSRPASTTIVLNKLKESSTVTVVKDDVNAVNEMKRILGCVDHYDVLGLSRYKKIDAVLLKKEYRKKAMLVHPDKNMGSALASESFKKIQCAYEVLSDSLKKRDYDEQLRKKESKSLSHKSPSTSDQDPAYCSVESRRIQCTKCGHSHVWTCTNRIKSKARWCQDCCQFHPAKDGDGWVEYRGSLSFDRPNKVEIPRAFVCAESKIFDVSEWAICQGMGCRPNTHRPTFHVNMVGLEKPERSNSSRYPWDLDAKMADEEEEFELWLKQALASGLFTETSKRRKSWGPFKLPQKKGSKRMST
ncbi:dnaJ domain, Cleavage inducing molecular chaperone, Jiv [Artemisia annua]|uniref:DnaJ domain, Cleavage inducing molecular chaperone, Jiv n=1 Tax=Artemisia annua TaxID=35608 RepID=A0A2U1PF69_ARTAN|nr:dnaJ domain, Cleavage inducing molecular chaperone, Jiv [Artemisia annua]